MNEIEIFKNEEFGEIRTAEIDGNPVFCLVDLCKALELKQPSKVKNRLKQKGVHSIPTLTSGGNQILLYVDEPNLYKVIMQSRKESAERFSDWIVYDVLPSIRKHGAYMTDETLEKALLSPDFLIQLATKLKEEQEKNKQLSGINEALTERAHEWENKPTLNALIRAYAIKECNGIFGNAWNQLYKNLAYGEHIDLKKRKGHSGMKDVALINFIHDDEFNKVLKMAVAMCEKSGIDTYKIINETNMKKVS